MRVCGGILKGMAIGTPPGLATRPTSAKIREALMSSLAAELEEARVLDLFAGSGAFSWEALSRGAASTVLIDTSSTAVQAIRKNGAEVKRRFAVQQLTQPGITIMAKPWERCMAALRAEPKFDLIWADPPYKDGMAHATRLLQELQTLARPGACFILESDKSLEQPIQALTAEMSVWQLVKQRAYGNTMIHRFEFGTANSCGDDHD